MINLFEQLCLNVDGGFDLISSNTKVKDFDELLMKKLEDGRIQNDFINVKGIRGIGKTKVLVDFAKKYDYTIVVQSNASVLYIKTFFKYPKVVNKNKINSVKGKFVFDELFDDISCLNKYKKQIVTGYVNYIL